MRLSQAQKSRKGGLEETISIAGSQPTYIERPEIRQSESPMLVQKNSNLDLRSLITNHKASQTVSKINSDHKQEILIQESQSDEVNDYLQEPM